MNSNFCLPYDPNVIEQKRLFGGKLPFCFGLYLARPQCYRTSFLMGTLLFEILIVIEPNFCWVKGYYFVSFLSLARSQCDRTKLLSGGTLLFCFVSIFRELPMSSNETFCWKETLLIISFRLYLSRDPNAIGWNLCWIETLLFRFVSIFRKSQCDRTNFCCEFNWAQIEEFIKYNLLESQCVRIKLLIWVERY